MTKILAVAMVGLLIGGIGYIFLFMHKPSSTPATLSPQNNLQNNVATQPAQLATSIPQASSSSVLESRIATLEQTIIDLQKQINANKGTSSLNSVALKAPLYIPLGIGASSSSLDWETSNAFQVTIDPAQYPGYSSMQLEMGLQVFQGNGLAFARLYDTDDGQAISNSDISSPTEFFTWQSSGNFRLPTGSKTYKLQLRTSTTYQASQQNARIKVNF